MINPYAYKNSEVSKFWWRKFIFETLEKRHPEGRDSQYKRAVFEMYWRVVVLAKASHD